MIALDVWNSKTRVYVFLIAWSAGACRFPSDTPRRCINLSLPHLHGDWKQYVLYDFYVWFSNFRF